MHKNRQHGFSMIEILVVMLIALVIAAMAVPGFQSVARYLRITGDNRALFGTVSAAKMRAGAEFTKARAYLDLSANTYHIDVWDGKNSIWSAEGGTQYLTQGVSAGYGTTVTTGPTAATTTAAQAALCDDGAGGTVANTSCIVFNSRGIPIDSTNAPVGGGAFYITDGNTVYAVTVGITGLIQSWSTGAASTGATWQRR